MAGYIYCMKNDHCKYGRYLKIGCTERMPEIRTRELSEKWHCKFELLWDMPVYDPAEAESYFHKELNMYWIEHEFFRIDSEFAKQLAERLFNEHWREIEGKEKIILLSIVELTDIDAQGIILDPEQSQYDADFEPYPD